VVEKERGDWQSDCKRTIINPQRTDEMSALVWGHHGLFKSVDGGETWVEEYIDTDYDQIHDLAVHPIHPQYLAAGTSSSSGGVEMSEDGGKSWRKCGRPPRGVYNLTFDPVDPDIVYVSEHDALYRSNDGCRTWDSIEQHGMSPFGFLEADPSRPRTLYHGSSDGVIVSSNGGNVWRRYGPNADPLLCPDIAMSPSDPDVLYLAAEAMDERRGVFHSGDGGLTWKIGMTALFANRVESIEWNPADPTIAYAGASTGYSGNGVFKTWDSGNTWSFSRIPGVVYASTGQGLNRSTDWGESWVHSATGLEAPPDCWIWGCGEYEWVTEVVFDPTDADVLYAITKVGAFRSADGGISWEVAREGMLICCELRVWSDECDAIAKTSGPLSCEGGPRGFAVDPDRPYTVYATTKFGTYRSYNRGGKWERITGSEETNPEAIVAVADGLLFGASDRAGVLRLNTSPMPSPRRDGRRVSTSGSITPKARLGQLHK